MADDKHYMDETHSAGLRQDHEGSIRAFRHNSDQDFDKLVEKQFNEEAKYARKVFQKTDKIKAYCRKLERCSDPEYREIGRCLNQYLNLLIKGESLELKQERMHYRQIRYLDCATHRIANSALNLD